MRHICLDTSAYSHFKAGHGQTIEIITRARRVSVPSIVLGELRTGFKLGNRYHQNEIELGQFLANPVVEVLDVDSDAACNYAEIVVALRRRGTPIPTNDIWISALAMRESAAVVTFDKHFDLIAGLSVLKLSHE